MGGFPVPSLELRDPDGRALRFSGCVQTYLDLQPQRPEVLYWRTAAGQEVDFVIETPKRMLPIEVKAAARVTPWDAKGLEAFLDEYPDLTDGALVLHTGNECMPLTGRVLAVPWWQVC